MTERESMSQRLRFEVFKRDGFQCRYCGATATATPLHVDHVVPVANGGPTEPANLVTACAACNQGKSCVPLDEPRIEPAAATAASIAEHALQVRAYLRASQELADARAELRDWILEHYEAVLGKRVPYSLRAAMASICDQHPVDRIIYAIETVAAKRSREYLNDESECRYFYGVLRKQAST